MLKSRVAPIPEKLLGAPRRIPTVPSEFSPAYGHPEKVHVRLPISTADLQGSRSIAL